VDPTTEKQLAVRIEHLYAWPKHIPTIAEWQHRQFGYLNPSGTIEQREQRLREAVAPDRLPIALVALSSEHLPVGSANIVQKTLAHQHLTPWLSSVFVPAEHRGGGIASALSLRAVEEAARLGFAELYLFTPHNEALFARLGWRTFDHTLHNGLPLTLMRRATGGVMSPGRIEHRP
jgi:predicted N-acetyltransferase YhbS